MEKITVTGIGEATFSRDPKEVVVAVSPAFGERLKETIMGVSLGSVIKEISAGIEAEGMKPRFIKVWGSTDLAIIASVGSKLSGSGISIGLQSRGTAVIHQKNMVPLNNLELLPQSPLYNGEIYRQLGRNAAQYAKGESPEPIEILNDFMAPSKFLIKSTLLHLEETEVMDKAKKTLEIEISMT